MNTSDLFQRFSPAELDALIRAMQTVRQSVAPVRRVVAEAQPQAPCSIPVRQQREIQIDEYTRPLPGRQQQWS